MVYIQISQPTVIKYEPTDLDSYVEEQLKKHDFMLTQHNFHIYEKGDDAHAHLTRKTTKPNSKGHHFFYDLSYEFDYAEMFDLHKNIKAENLAKELSLSSKPSQEVIQFRESLGIYDKKTNRNLLEFKVISLGYSVLLETNSLIPNDKDMESDLSGFEEECYNFLELPKLVDPLVEFFMSGKYDIKD